jgi:hypothetical protein
MGFSQNRFDDADNTKVLLSWDTPGSGTSVQNYKLTYAVGTQPPIDCTSPNFTLTNITLSKTVTGLNPSLDYAFRLCAFNSTALPTTSTGSVAIVYAIPSNPISLQSEVKSNAKVKLTWDHGTIPGSWYKVAWAAGSAPANCDSGTAASGFTSHTVTGLDPSTTYGFLVCAYNSNQTYNFSSGTTVNGTTDSSDFHFLPGKFGFKKNPQVLINNLPSTHQVKLYLDENCTGTDLLNDAGTGVGMTSHTFTPSYASPLGVGTHMFYYKVLNSIPSWSTCLEGDEYTVKGPPDIYLHQDGHYHLSWINRDNENVVNSGYHLYVVENGGTPSLLGNYTLTQDLQLTGWNPGSQYKYFISTEFPGSVFVNSDYSNIVTAPGLFSVTPLSVNFAAGIDMTSAVDGKGVIDYFDFNIALEELIFILAMVVVLFIRTTL